MVNTSEAEPRDRTEIIPALTVRDVVRAIEFYIAAFGARELYRAAEPDGTIIIAQLAIGDAQFSLSGEAIETKNVSPEGAGGTTVRLDLVVTDPDAVAARAIEAGATEMFPIEDRPYGWRQGRIADPFGHQWIIGRPLG